jgi:hypothetical protein
MALAACNQGKKKVASNVTCYKCGKKGHYITNQIVDLEVMQRITEKERTRKDLIRKHMWLRTRTTLSL